MIQNLIVQNLFLPHSLLLYAMTHPCFIHARLAVNQDSFSFVFIQKCIPKHHPTPCSNLTIRRVEGLFGVRHNLSVNIVRYLFDKCEGYLLYGLCL